ncbi:hypothetical protein A6R68_09082, partial [Neotoma lepida]
MFPEKHNAEGDYQLCFSSGQEKAPCPLLGHENPYAIKMSELGNDAFMALGPSSHTAYLNIQKMQELQAPHDMLSLLNEAGPHVEGIFRKSANAASCQTLKEKLDLGKDVNLREESILVVASVLK